jgi:hypothetical protein
MAEEYDVNTVVPGNPASGDEVTQAGNPVDDKVTQPKPTGTKATKIRVTDIDRLLEYAVETDESPASILTRVLDEHTRSQGAINDFVSSNEHLQKVNAEIRETLEEEQQRHQAKFDEQVGEIGQLQARITTLENTAGTAVVPAGGQVTLDSFGIKDIVEDARDMCGDDDPTCMKVASKMLDMKAHFASKAVDHDHTAEQNRLDRDQKELDRKLKEEQAAKDREEKEKERQLKKELSYIKKGYIPKGDLDDLVDIGRIQPKNAKKSLGYAKKQANAEADEEETPARSGLTEGEMDEEEWDE